MEIFFEIQLRMKFIEFNLQFSTGFRSLIFSQQLGLDVHQHLIPVTDKITSVQQTFLKLTLTAEGVFL